MKMKSLGVFHLVMINIIAVDSLRTLPFSAQFGFSLIFYFIIAAALFFVPSGLISAELGTAWPHTGGIYVWVKEAFGKKAALIAIWLNWVNNLVWYPTIMSLIAASIAYIIDPNLASNKTFMATVIISLFWGASLLNCLGMRISSLISTIGALVGTIFPMLLLITLAVIWVSVGNPKEIVFSWKALIPSDGSSHKLALFSNVLFGLIGLEMVATHASEMRDPKKDYPKALLISSILIISMMTFASLAIAIVVPGKDLNLVTGVLQAFTIFFERFNIPWMIYVVAGCMVLGALSGVSAWIIGPTKGVMVAARDESLPKFFTKVNSRNAPTGALFIQAVVMTLLTLLIIVVPSVSGFYWFLSIITAELGLVVYVILFAASIRLHHYQSEVPRAFKIPGGNLGIWIVASSGLFISLFAILVGISPPDQLTIHSPTAYEFLLVAGLAFIALLPLGFYYHSQWSRKKMVKND